MSDMLSQAEIDALLSGSNIPPDEDNFTLLPHEADAIGEIGNISMGAAATALYSLIGHKVTITTPHVIPDGWGQLAGQNAGRQMVAVKIEYTDGLQGGTLLLLKEEDVKLITDLMMGGDGSNTDGPLNDLHLSAISEAMNQMIGTSATSLSELFSKRIFISPPKAFILDFDNLTDNADMAEYTSTNIIIVSFKMVIGDLVNSEIMQLMPAAFAKELVRNLMDMVDGGDSVRMQEERIPSPGARFYPEEAEVNRQYDSMEARKREPVNVQPVKFESFDTDYEIPAEKKNISILMDVALEVTVELGRTHKLIKEILEMGPGSIIELDKLAEEPVDILINGKKVAVGEVVVIDESFGVRITDIVHPSKRL